jgi:hypothetical protein
MPRGNPLESAPPLGHDPDRDAEDRHGDHHPSHGEPESRRPHR